jgi:ribose transport system ATP-binding protein
MIQARLEVKNLIKEYPGTIALKGFSAVFDGGKVYALLGKNGSGKSTLVKCISGAVQPSSGEMSLDGHVVRFQNPAEASESGIAIVYQELSLVLDFSVAENIFIGRYAKTAMGTIDWDKTNADAAKILASLRIDIPVTKKVSKLSVGQRQMVEIAKAMSRTPRVLILDEPTSALARQETESLMEVVRRSREQGLIIIYITHKLNEIKDRADFVTVLRDGNLVGSLPMAQANPKTIVDMMFGETTLRTRPADLRATDEKVMEVSGLTREGKFRDVTFSLYKGEILGIAGMLGAGRSELLRGIFGVDPIDAGEIVINGKIIRKPNIRQMKRLGLAMTPENRKDEGLVQIMPISDNLCYASLSAVARRGIITRRRQDPVVERWIRELDIMVSDPHRPVSSLSGGNQEKVVVGNWLNTKPSVVFFDEPSRGIDVQAKQQIFQIMWELARKGLSVIFVSSELEELLEVCHRILVMEDGCIKREVRPENTSLDELYAYCMEG